MCVCVFLGERVRRGVRMNASVSVSVGVAAVVSVRVSFGVGG